MLQWVPKKLKQLLLAVGTAGAAAMIAYTFVPAPIILGTLLILVAHELGHYFSAHSSGAYPDLPIFLSLGLIVVGLTQVHELNPVHRPSVAIAGPFAGMYVGLSLCIVSLLVASPSLLYIGILGTSVEFSSLFFGSDNKKFHIRQEGIPIGISRKSINGNVS